MSKNVKSLGISGIGISHFHGYVGSDVISPLQFNDTIMNVTEKQKRLLLQYMKENEDFSRGRLRYNGGNRKILDEMWNTVSISLNCTGSGPQKQAKEWQKTWRDWKSNVLKKCASNRSYARGTGGGPPKILQLTELEEDLLTIIDPESTGLLDIPEGGNFDRLHSKGSAKQGVSKRCLPISGYETCHTFEVERELDSFTANRPCPITDAADVFLPCTSRTRDDEDLWIPGSAEAEENVVVFGADSETEETIINAPQDENINIVKRILPKKKQSVNEAPDKDTIKIKVKKRQNASTAVMESMDKQLKIKQEKLEVSKETLRLNKEKFEYMKSTNNKFLNIFTDINTNLTFLRQEIEKIAPSYLDQ